MVEKRQLDEAANGGADGTAASASTDAKKPRLSDVTAPAAGSNNNGAAAAVPVARGLSLEALAKAKRALQLQKEIKEKMKAQGIQSAAFTAGPAGSLAAAAAGTQRAAMIAASFGAPVSLPASLPGAAAPRPLAVVPPGFQPPPLRLVQGREVDAYGNSVPSVQPPASLMVNQQRQQLLQAAHAAAMIAPTPVARTEEPAVDIGFDPRLARTGRRKGKATFDFVHEGTFQKQAEIMRIKGRYGQDAFRKQPDRLVGPAAAPGEDANSVPLGVRGGAAPFDANSVPIGVRRPSAAAAAATAAEDVDMAAAAFGGGEAVPELLLEQLAAEPVPEVEWWDRALLATGSYEADVEAESLHIKEPKITHYVAHPVPIEPPAEAPPPPPQPLKLTKRELKKLRTQRRQAREKEKQELIRQGLLEAAKPKVKISNLSRVLGEQAIADPTALEKEVRKQMVERQAAHEDRNLARKLTPAELAAKKERRLFGAGAGGAASDDDEADAAAAANEIVAAVYRIERLSNPRTRYKVDMNAKENKLTGVLLLAEPFALVVVEGVPKAIKRYNKLMLRRINWSLVMQDVEGGGPGEQEEVEEDADDVPAPNACSLVWQGVVPKAAFTDFRVEPRADGPTGGRNKVQPKALPAVDAKQLLQQRGIAHYWDAAAGHRTDEAPASVLPS